MMRMVRHIVLALVLLLAFWPAAASALPIIGAVVAAVGITGVAATVVTAVVAVGVSIGINYIASQFLKPAQNQQRPEKQEVGGAELQIRLGVDVPQSFIVGRAVTAGSMVYANVYGTRGETDNSDMIEVISVADYPTWGLHAAFIDGERAVLRDTGTDRGLVVDGYIGPLGTPDINEIQNMVTSFTGSRVGLLGFGAFEELLESEQLQEKGGLVAIRYFDGLQTAADSFAVAALSGHSTPWTANHVGKGVSYVRVHSIFNREKVSGSFKWKFVVEGARLYDPRKDSTVAGGSGAHRWNPALAGTPSTTYEWTDNPVVIAYNVLRGIYLEGEIFYGLEGTAADQLPLDVWFAAMNECDVGVDRGDGQIEKQYTCGAEITLDTEPMDTIKALLKTCGGRFCDIGGVYKVYVGVPGLPVVSITDGDMLSTRDEVFKPVQPLQQRINTLTGTFTSPENGWVPWVAPPREIPDWIDEDGRTLPAELVAPMVQSSTQMQRLMLQMLQRARRERNHTVALPPWALALEPGDVIGWTSVRNGYVSKLFEIDSVELDHRLTGICSVTEVDPADYDWETGFELPEADGHLVTILPAPRVIDGFDAEGFTYFGDLGTGRPAIKILWDPPTEDDLVAVAWQIRIASDPANATSGRTDNVAAGQEIIVAAVQPATNYQVRAKFDRVTGWGTDWSLWIPVTTPDTRLATADFSAALQHLLIEYRKEADRLTRANNQRIGALLTELATADVHDRLELTRNLRRTEGQVTAAYSEAIEVATGPSSALAQRITELSAEILLAEERVTASYSEAIQVLAQQVGGELSAVAALTGTLAAAVDTHTAQLQTRFVVGVTQSGALATYELQATAEQASAGLRVVAMQSGSERIGFVYVDADRFYVGKTGQAGFNPVFIVDTSTSPARIILNADLIAPGSITASKISVGTLSAITTQTGDLFVGQNQSVRILGSQSRLEFWDAT